MRDQSKIDAIQHIIATLFSAVPEYKWAGLGNLLGDFGEFVAIEAYGLEKAPAGSSGYDAVCDDGKTVQIKTNHATSQIGYRGEADLMLVIHVNSDGQWEEVYYGNFQSVKAMSRYSARYNKHMIAISKLRGLAQSTSG